MPENLTDAELAEKKRKLIAELEAAARRIHSDSAAEALALKQQYEKALVERDGYGGPC
jgi:hypothetical protein